jgi:nucleoside-diphosphate-sugar epimerase
MAQQVLILGGQGYLGSRLTVYLHSVAIPVYSVDARSAEDPLAVPSRSQHFQELTPEDFQEFDTVVLLAGHSSVAACDHSPAEAFANNVTAFVDLVHKLRGQKLIFASTISVYVDTAGRLAEETDPLPDPVSFYDFHKQELERYARLAHPNHFALRLGTVCGPSPAVRTELLLNSLVWSALTKGYVEIANASAHRPLLGINDLCRAVEAIVTRPVSPGCYNLASVNVRIGEVAEYVAQRFGVPCRPVERPNRYDVCVDTRKFTAAAGFEFQDTIAGLVDSLHAFYTARLKAGNESERTCEEGVLAAK